MKEMNMNTALWIVTGFLAVAYLAGGVTKLVVPRQKFATFPTAGWANDFSDRTFKILGVLEILGAVGLVLPVALDIAPVLVPVAALGLVLYMAGAAFTRLRRREVMIMVGDLAYLALAGFVAWGRFGPESFT
jgi:uncharacterized membrane protein